MDDAVSSDRIGNAFSHGSPSNTFSCSQFGEGMRNSPDKAPGISPLNVSHYSISFSDATGRLQGPNILLPSMHGTNPKNSTCVYLSDDMTPELAFSQYQCRSEDKACQVCAQPSVGFHHRAYVCEACKVRSNLSYFHRRPRYTVHHLVQIIRFIQNNIFQFNLESGTVTILGYYYLLSRTSYVFLTSAYFLYIYLTIVH